MRPTSADARARALLLAGCLGGIALAALSLADSGRPTAPDGGGDAVAWVDGRPIPREALERMRAVTTGRRDAPDRARLVQRLVDEELLLQRGLALDLARSEGTARRAIVSAVIALATAEAEFETPDEATLRAFHAEAPERFGSAPRVKLDVLHVDVDPRPEAEAYARAAEIAGRLRAGEPRAEVRALADPAPRPIPSGSLPEAELPALLGAVPARALARVEPGGVSDPLRGPEGYHVVALDAREPGPPAPFDLVRDSVAATWRREQASRALEAYLEALRDEADVRIAEGIEEGR